MTDETNRKACEELGIFIPEGVSESSPQGKPEEVVPDIAKPASEGQFSPANPA